MHVSRALEKFRATHKKGYHMVHCWDLLKNNNKWMTSFAADVGITLRVTDVALSCIDQLEAHEDTRRLDGPLGRRTRRFLDGQDKEANKQGKIGSKLL